MESRHRSSRPRVGRQNGDAVSRDISWSFQPTFNPLNWAMRRFLRRIKYKMLVKNPSLTEFREIFRMYFVETGT